MTKPNVFIVGAAKAGTTSLYFYLIDHPDVYFPREMKEINFLSDANISVRTESEYLQLFAGSEKFPVRIDISTSYLYEAQTAARVRAFAGEDAKIVAVLRNPIDAAHSLWKQMRHYESEPLSFEDAIAAEQARMIDDNVRAQLKGWPANFFYTTRFTYTPQIERYLELFPRENVAIYIFEEFFGDLRASWKELCSFLAIDPTYEPAGLGKVYNPSGHGVRFHYLYRALYEDLRWKRLFTWAIPVGWKTRLRILLDDMNKTKDATAAGDGLHPATRRRLQEHFSSDVRALEKLLGRPLKDVWF